MEDYRKLFSLAGKKLLVAGVGRHAEAIAGMLAAQGADVEVMDFRNAGEAKVRDRIRAFIEEKQRLDGLVICEAVREGGRLDHFDEARWKRLVDGHIRNVHMITREAGKYMLRQEYGRIIYLSLMESGDRAPAYRLCKGALSMYSRQIACEWASGGITSNSIFIPRVGAQEMDAAGVFLRFLISEAAEFVTGQVFCLEKEENI